jgi:nitrate/nitrite-specific signal transduction histidine kinase
MDKLRDFFESTGKDVDPIISEISLMKQLIKERVHPLDLIRELLSNAGAKEVDATEIHINYYVNQDGHVFEISDNGCGMNYTGERNLPGRLVLRQSSSDG